MSDFPIDLIDFSVMVAALIGAIVILIDAKTGVITGEDK